MPQPMNEKTGYQFFKKKRVYGGARRAAEKHLQAAAEQVRAAYVDMNLGYPDDDGIFEHLHLHWWQLAKQGENIAQWLCTPTPT